jgi:hypothetical protein
MTTTFHDEDQFVVLRVAPLKPPRRPAEDVLLAKIDLIDPNVKLLLIDCELRRAEGFREVSVRIPDLSVLSRYFLEPGFSGEFDFGAVLSQVHFAVCRHFDLSTNSDSFSCKILWDFVVSPRWKEWINTHRAIPSTTEAIKSYNDKNLAAAGTGTATLNGLLGREISEPVRPLRDS